MNDIDIQTLETEIQLSHEIKSYRRVWAAKMAVHLHDYTQGIEMADKADPKNRAPNNEIMRNARRAYHWIFDEATEPSSFKWVCEILNIDFARARNKITSMKGSKNVFNY